MAPACRAFTPGRFSNSSAGERGRIYSRRGKLAGKQTHPHKLASCSSVASTISSSRIRSSPPNTDISRWSATLRIPPRDSTTSLQPSSRQRKGRRALCSHTSTGKTITRTLLTPFATRILAGTRD